MPSPTAEPHDPTADPASSPGSPEDPERLGAPGPIGRGTLLVAGPAVVAVFWAFGALPAWGAAAIGLVFCAVALVFLARLRPATNPGTGEGARVLVVGGGYAGLVAARALQARLPGGTRGGRHLGAADDTSGIAAITVVDPQAHMTYQPFLPEGAAGAIEPRHLTVPLRRVLRRCDVVTGAVAAIDDGRRHAVVSLPDGGTRDIPYDVLVVAPGTSPRRLPVPGLDERALPFRSVTDALALREHVLSRLDAAASTSDPSERRRLLTFVVIGGGFAGLEVLGELEDMTRRAAKHQPGHIAGEIRWVLLEAAGRIMPEVSSTLAARVHAQLLRRGVEVKVGATIHSAHGGELVLAGGTRYQADTIVVAAGSVPNPLLERTDLPLDARGRVRCTTTLQARDRAHVFTAGDCAAVPDMTVPVPRDGDPATTAPTAQHAVRQARLLARNVDAFLAGKHLKGYRHRSIGAVAGLGRRRGAAQLGPLRLTGWSAFMLHRSYHLWAMPTADRTVRIALDWLVSGLLGRDLVAVGRRDTPPLPDVDAPPTVEPRAAGTVAELTDRNLTPVSPVVWGADPSATGSQPAATPAPRAVHPTPDPDPRSEGIPALQIAAAQTSGEFPVPTEATGATRTTSALDGPLPAVALDASAPLSGPFPAPSAGPTAEPFREPLPSLSFGAADARDGEPDPYGDPLPSGAFAEPTPSTPLPVRDQGRESGPRAPYPSTSVPRHSSR